MTNAFIGGGSPPLSIFPNAGDVMQTPEDNAAQSAANQWDTYAALYGPNTTATDPENQAIAAMFALLSTVAPPTASNDGVGGVGVYIETLGDVLSLKNIAAGDASITVTDDVANKQIDIAVAANTSTQKINVDKNGTLVGTRHEVNLIEGTSIVLTVADNAGSDRVDATIATAQAIGTGASPTFNGLTLTNPLGVGQGGTNATTAGSARSNLGLAIGTNVEAWSTELDGLAALAAGGMVARTGAGTYSPRTITGTANRVTVSNGDGVAGNPTLTGPQDIHTAATPQFAGIGVGTASGTTGITINDGANVILGSTSGTKFGTATTQKIGFFNAAPVVQQTAGTAALVNSTGGTPALTIPAPNATYSSTQQANVWSSFARAIIDMHAALAALGLTT